MSEDPKPIRIDLAIPACEIAAKATDLSTAQAFALTALDFLTGTYEPLEDDGQPTPSPNNSGREDGSSLASHAPTEDRSTEREGHLENLLKIIDDLDAYQKRPSNGDYGVECACCMGELFDALDRVDIEAARVIIASHGTSPAGEAQRRNTGLPVLPSFLEAVKDARAALQVVIPDLPRGEYAWKFASAALDGLNAALAGGEG